jgi:hypothetical protein
MLGAPRSRSAHARRGAGSAWRLQTPASAGVAAEGERRAPLRFRAADALGASVVNRPKRTLKNRAWPQPSVARPWCPTMKSVWALGV